MGARDRRFAGSGIFSFEAVSRGAQESVAIDSSRAHTAAIDKAARELNAPIRTLTADAINGIDRVRGEVFDVVYADPPYDYDRYDDLLLALDTRLTLAPDALVAIEHRRGTAPFAANLTRLQHSRRTGYGEVWISFFIP